LTNFNFSGGSTTSIAISFTATDSTAVLAWGGHIATRHDWGVNNAATSLTGSPFVMGLSDFWGVDVPTGFCPLELCLPRGGVVFTSSLTIIKDASIIGGTTFQPFDFTVSSNFGGVSSFTLFDNGVAGADRITRTYLGGTDTITIVENITAGWSLTDISCNINAGGGLMGVATGTIGLRQLQVQLNQGNSATCTFTNTFAGPTAATATVSGRVLTKAGLGIRGALVTVNNAASGTSRTAITNSFGYYSFSDLPVNDYYVLSVTAKRYTFSNSQQSFVVQGDAAGINFTSDQ